MKFNQLCYSGLLCLALLTGCSKHGGKVVDAKSNQPIADAIVVHNGIITHSDKQGKFALSKFDAKQPVLVKVAGYRRAKAEAQRFTDSTVRLEPFQSKGVYLSFGALKTDTAREAVMAMFDGSDLNTLVIDVKNERGFISLDCEAGADIKVSRAAPPAIDDMEAFIKELHAKNIYVIGRLQTFRDDALGHDRPDLAITDLEEKPWKDGSGMKWGDPFRKEVQDYNVAVAVTAAAAGFDEIQFANVNSPGGNKFKLSKENNSQNRNVMRKEFWGKVGKALASYNVFISSEFWGPALFSKDAAGTKIVLQEAAQTVDYFSPTVFPADLSGMFPSGKKKSALFPYLAVFESIKRGGEMLGSPAKFRPWLQHYQSTVLKTPLTEREVAMQIQAATDAGASGFLLWQAASRYTNTAEALKLFVNGSVKPEAIEAAATKNATLEATIVDHPAESIQPESVETAKANANTNKQEVANP